MRRTITFECGGDRLIGTLDHADGETGQEIGQEIGLLIVSGGNEIRCGAYAGQATIAQIFAALGYPVFRYDRRGVGDSEGENNGFESSRDDIAAAITAFQAAAPKMRHMVAFGNCDAASALLLFHKGLAVDALILANPWVSETDIQDDAPHTPSAAAIRARYLARIKNPRTLIDMIMGKIDLKKLISGLIKASKKNVPSNLATRVATALKECHIPVRLLIAKRDTTALEFMGTWFGEGCSAARSKANISLSIIDSASHSFADAGAKAWLIDQILGCLGKAK
jgi:exosortase A-associated hydrolase 1